MSNDKKVYIFSADNDVAELLETMGKHTNDGTEGVLREGIVLYGIYLQAQKLGHKLAILDKDDRVIDTVVIK